MLLIIFVGSIILLFIGALVLLKLYHQEKDVLRIWFPVAILFTISLWFLRYDHGNYDDKAGYYMGSVVVRKAPESVKWLNRNIENFSSIPNTTSTPGILDNSLGFNCA